MARVTFRGVTLDARTRDMLAEVERLGGHVTPTQGSYSRSVSASGGTHDGGGAVDLRATDLTKDQILDTVRAGRMVGFAMWHRSPDEGPWPEHIHGIAAGAPDLSGAASRQVAAYRRGLSGLASGRADKHTGALGAWRSMTWEKYLAERESEMPLSDDDVQRIARAVWNADLIPYEKADGSGKPASSDNPNWRPLSVLANGELIARQLAAAVVTLGKKIDKLAAAPK